MPALAASIQSNLARQVHELIEDLEGEVQRELHHDNSQSDIVLRKHLMGLILILFSMVALILTASIVFIALYRPHG